MRILILFSADADPGYQNDPDLDADPDPQHWLDVYLVIKSMDPDPP